MRKRYLLIWMLLITFVVCGSFLSPTLPDVIKDVDPAVVQIIVRDENGQKRLGSGAIVHEHGLILTARHIIEDVNDIEVTLLDGRKYKCIDKITDPNNDVGIIRIASLEDLSIIKFSDGVQVGEEVFIIGSPFGLRNSVALGIVAGKDRSVLLFGTGFIMQLDIAGNPGNSGCPVFNMSGRIVGIVVGGVQNGDGITFVIPVNVCKELVKGYVERNN